MSPVPYPIVRLKPKANARAVRHGFPWVYDSDLVTDRRTKALPPGSIAVLEDAERALMGVVAINTASRIALRLLDIDPGARIEGAWVREKLGRALSLREKVYDLPYYRLVHGEADGFPGVVVDRFGDIAVIQPNAAWADASHRRLGVHQTPHGGCCGQLTNSGNGETCG